MDNVNAEERHEATLSHKEKKKTLSAESGLANWYARASSIAPGPLRAPFLPATGPGEGSTIYIIFITDVTTLGAVYICSSPTVQWI